MPEKRILAYPIKHCRIGFCGLIKFENDAATVSKMDEKLRMMPNIIRHRIFIYKETQKPSFEKETEKRRGKKVIKPKEKPMAEEKAKEAPKTEKIKLEELDKKLEELLKE